MLGRADSGRDRVVRRVAALGAIAVLSACQSGGMAPPSGAAAQFTLPGRMSAQYTIVNLGGLGGTVNDTGVSISNRQWTVGGADLSGNRHERASLWRHGKITDLGTFGGPNSGSSTVNDSGVVVGGAQSAGKDPLGEGWGYLLVCKANGGPCKGWQHLLLAFEWQHNVLKQLPSLGGNNSWALANNNRGETVGVAETGERGKCVAPQVLKFEAVVWGPREGQVRKLRPLRGDSIGIALGNNNRGDVTGGSGPTCGFSFAYSTHAVLWRDNLVIDLGSLGGVMNNEGGAINNHEQIVGQSDLPGDNTGHAFLWQHGVMSDLGTLPGDVFSTPGGINDKGQVVGQSCDAAGNCRAFVWQNGTMTDLNTLIAPGPIDLLYAKDISPDGIIVGQAFNKKTHEILGFLATPTSSASEVRPSAVEQNPNLPNYLREPFWKRLQRMGPQT